MNYEVDTSSQWKLWVCSHKSDPQAIASYKLLGNSPFFLSDSFYHSNQITMPWHHYTCFHFWYNICIFLKSFCYIVEHVPTDGEWWAATKVENPERIIQVSNYDNGDVLCTLEQKEVKEVRSTIGYNLNIVESNEEAIKIRVTKAMQFNTAVLWSNLKPHQKRMAYRIFFVPSLTFPLRASTLSIDDLVNIRKPPVPMICYGLCMHQKVNYDYISFQPIAIWRYENTFIRGRHQRTYYLCFTK